MFVYSAPSSEINSMKMNYLITFFKGMAMGAADVVPGVSGGTIAFITGIYDTLLESIRRINPRLLSIWKREGTKAAFNHINGFSLSRCFQVFSLALQPSRNWSPGFWTRTLFQSGHSFWADFGFGLPHRASGRKTRRYSLHHLISWRCICLQHYGA